MSKRKPKKNRRSTLFNRLGWRSRPAIDLESVFEEAENLVEQGRPEEAVALLEPLANTYRQAADLQSYLGYAYAHSGKLWAALSSYERALELSRDMGFWLPLAPLYLQLGLNAHALNAFRQVEKYKVEEVPAEAPLSEAIASLEASVQEMVDNLNLPAGKVEKGLYSLEEGQRALHQGDYQHSIIHNRKAIQLLGDWPPPHNNLSLALFFNGQPQEAIATVRRVLAQGPNNLQALSNGIRFLAWTGREAEARALWPRLQQITPLDDNDRFKKAEAAAILEEDEAVYELLKPLDQSGARPVEAASQISFQLFLAVAEANTNRQKAARRRLKALKPGLPWAGALLSALEAGQPGPGWASRYPYFHSSEYMPRSSLEAWIELVGQKDRLSPRKYQQRVAEFAARYPQLVRMAEKLIIEENQVEPGTMMLALLGTPEAYAALRRFGLSQVGDDEARMQALFRLMEAGQLKSDENLQVWSDGQWQEVQLRQYEITDEPEVLYSPEAANLINRAMKALQQNKDKQAEQLLHQAIKLEPRAKEAYNNLAVVYSRRDEHEQAKEMYRKAIDIDPLYVFPRANLALYLLYEDDVEGAEKMLEPLATATRFTPQEMAFYAYIQAQIAMYKEEFDKARQSLEMALEIMPDYKPAQELLERVDLASRMLTGWERFREQQQKRDQNRRAKLQQRVTTPEPSLAEVLPLYSKEVLVGMGREIIRWGGWSASRKPELVELIAEELGDRYNLERLVEELSDTEREALARVLAGGGQMDWQEFAAQYGSDMEESPYWQYHAPESVMGRLRLRGLLAEATVDNQLLLVIPAEVRPLLSEVLKR